MCKPVSSRCRNSSIAASTSMLFLRMLPQNVAWLLVFRGPVLVPVHGVLEGLSAVKCVNTIWLYYKQCKLSKFTLLLGSVPSLNSSSPQLGPFQAIAQRRRCAQPFQHPFPCADQTQYAPCAACSWDIHTACIFNWSHSKFYPSPSESPADLPASQPTSYRLISQFWESRFFPWKNLGSNVNSVQTQYESWKLS